MSLASSGYTTGATDSPMSLSVGFDHQNPSLTSPNSLTSFTNSITSLTSTLLASSKGVLLNGEGFFRCKSWRVTVALKCDILS